jgi:hypothetical protein
LLELYFRRNLQKVKKNDDCGFWLQRLFHIQRRGHETQPPASKEVFFSNK